MDDEQLENILDDTSGEEAEQALSGAANKVGSSIDTARDLHDKFKKDDEEDSKSEAKSSDGDNPVNDELQKDNPANDRPQKDNPDINTNKNEKAPNQNINRDNPALGNKPAQPNNQNSSINDGSRNKKKGLGNKNQQQANPNFRKNNSNPQANNKSNPALGVGNKAKDGAKEGAKEGAKDTAKKGAKDAAKKGAKEGAKKAAEKGSKNAAEAIIKKIGWKWILIAGIILFVLFFVVMLVLMMAGGASSGDGYYGSAGGYNSYENCIESEYDISDVKKENYNGLGVYTYTGAYFKWAKASDTYEKVLSQYEFYADDDGFLRTDDFYLVAMGSFFGPVGTKYLINFEDGTSITAIKMDQKRDSETDPKHKYHLSDSSVLEFERACHISFSPLTDPKSYGINIRDFKFVKCNANGNEGTRIKQKFPSKIDSIYKISDDTDSCMSSSWGGFYGNGSGGFRQRNSSIYNDTKALNEIFAAAPNLRSLYNSRLRYQCPTYARLRAAEIILTARNYDAKTRAKAINVINNTSANGWRWTPDSLSGLRHFDWDKTCTKFQPGSIIAFNGSGADCSGSDGNPYSKPKGKCGHVAIVESVDQKNKKVVISDGSTSIHGAWHAVEYTFAQAKSSVSGGCRGVTYLLSYHD